MMCYKACIQTRRILDPIMTDEFLWGRAEQGEAIWEPDTHSVGADKRDETEEG